VGASFLPPGIGRPLAEKGPRILRAKHVAELRVDTFAVLFALRRIGKEARQRVLPFEVLDRLRDDRRFSLLARELDRFFQDEECVFGKVLGEKLGRERIEATFGRFLSACSSVSQWIPVSRIASSEGAKSCARRSSMRL